MDPLVSILGEDKMDLDLLSTCKFTLIGTCIVNTLTCTPHTIDCASLARIRTLRPVKVREFVSLMR